MRLAGPAGRTRKNIIRSQTHDKVRKLVNMLPPEQREVVILRHYADMSFKEIAKLTRVSINTALGRMRYALINIRKMVEEKEVILQQFPFNHFVCTPKWRLIEAGTIPPYSDLSKLASRYRLQFGPFRVFL
eukprot:TRINITY_DN8485_c0_g1_i1.p3 TRINITY_DN8485_c0_g1~~TRINITY_DN8485_c0_g1_i1.p3  ORF type:complete len:131 (+),score=3.94 TRINITY_DN8485_c0_g1_i1:60-452(+)